MKLAISGVRVNNFTVQDFIAQAKQRLEAATPGPWTAAEGGAYGGKGFVIAPTVNPSGMDDVTEWFSCSSNSETAANNCIFIAHAPTDLSLALQMLEIAAATLERVEQKTIWNNNSLEQDFWEINAQATKALTRMAEFAVLKDK